MAAETQIAWCDSTFNPWIGCTKVSPGCDNCYAEALMDHRMHRVHWGPQGERSKTSNANWGQPLRWEREHADFFSQHGRRRRVFCSSLADVFDNQVPAHWRDELFMLITSTPNLDWLLLTKRVGNVRGMVPIAWLAPGAWPANVRLGISVVNQPEADREIVKLLALRCPNFLSMEPLLGAVDLCKVPIGGHGHHEFDPIVTANVLQRREAYPPLPQVDWVIVGGESGANARPMHPDWARSLRDQCAAAGVPFFFKQWGEWIEQNTGSPQPLVAREGDPEFEAAAAEHDGFLSLEGHFVTDIYDTVEDVRYRGLMRVGTKSAGDQLDGRQHHEWPRSPA